MKYTIVLGKIYKNCLFAQRKWEKFVEIVFVMSVEKSKESGESIEYVIWNQWETCHRLT